MCVCVCVCVCASACVLSTVLLGLRKFPPVMPIVFQYEYVVSTWPLKTLGLRNAQLEMTIALQLRILGVHAYCAKMLHSSPCFLTGNAIPELEIFE